MPLTIWNCVLSYQEKNNFSEKGHVLPRNYYITEFPGSNFLLPTIYTSSNLDFQVANLLLATVNYEPCIWNLFSFCFCGVCYS